MKLDLRKLKTKLPLIFGCLSGVGVAATTYFAIKETRNVVEEEKKVDTDSLTTTAKIHFYGSSYKATILSGTATIGCIVGSALTGKANYAALGAAAMGIREVHQQYIEAVKEIGGEELHTQIMEKVCENEVPEDHCIYAGTFGLTSSLDFDGLDEPKVEFFEPLTKTSFMAKPSQVIQAEYHYNRNFQLSGQQNWYNFCELLGIDSMLDPEKKDYVRDIGFDVEYMQDDGIYWIDFNHKRYTHKNGMPYYMIETVFEPVVLDAIYAA